MVSVTENRILPLMPPRQPMPRVVDVLAESAETAGETVATVVEAVAVEAVVTHATPNKVIPFQTKRPEPLRPGLFYVFNNNLRK